MAPLSPARPSKSVQPHYIPQKGFKRLQMEEQWHLSLANEGPAVTSKGELRSVILIAGYFSADFIPGVSGKMSSLRSVLWLRGWSDSPRVDMEPPQISVALFEFAHVTWNEHSSTAALPSLCEELFALMFGLSQTRVLLYLFHLQLCWASPVRLRFDPSQTKFWLQSFSKSDKTVWNQPIVGEWGQFLLEPELCVENQGQLQSETEFIKNIWSLLQRILLSLSRHSFLFYLLFFHGTTFPNRQEWEKKEQAALWEKIKHRPLLKSWGKYNQK